MKTAEVRSEQFARHTRLAILGATRSVAWLDRHGWTVEQAKSAAMIRTAMTKREAKAYVRDHTDDDVCDDDDLTAAFAALAEREPDREEYRMLWLNICALAL